MGGIEKLDPVGQAFGVAGMVGLAHPHHLLDEIFLLAFLEHGVEGKAQDVGEKPDLLHHGDDLVHRGQAVVARDAVGLAPGVDGIEQVGPDGAFEDEGMLGHHAHVVGDVGLGQGVDVVAVKGGLAAGVFEDLAQAKGQGGLARAGKTDQGREFARGDVQGHALEQLDAAGHLQHHVLGRQRAGQGQGRARIGRLLGKFRVALEIFHDAVVADRGVLVGLIEIHQLLPGIVELLVGREKGHQRAEVEAAVYRQIAAYEKEHEGPEVLEEIVGDLDGELVEVPDHAHLEELVGHGPEALVLQAEAGVGVDFVDAGNGLADKRGELAAGVHALLVGGVGPFLQGRDDQDGDGIQGHADDGHERIQIEEVAGEGEQRQHVGDGHGDGLAHEFAGVGHLGDERGDHHAGRGLAEKRHGEL